MGKEEGRRGGRREGVFVWAAGRSIACGRRREGEGGGVLVVGILHRRERVGKGGGGGGLLEGCCWRDAARRVGKGKVVLLAKNTT